jgi:hypothetical protein
MNYFLEGTKQELPYGIFDHTHIASFLVWQNLTNLTGSYGPALTVRSLRVARAPHSQGTYSEVENLYSLMPSCFTPHQEENM